MTKKQMLRAMQPVRLNLIQRLLAPLGELLRSLGRYSGGFQCFSGLLVMEALANKQCEVMTFWDWFLLGSLCLTLVALLVAILLIGCYQLSNYNPREDW